MDKNRTADNREVIAAFSVLSLVDARSFIFGAQPQPDGVFQDQSQNSCPDSRIGENTERADCLSPQLVESATVKQAGRDSRDTGDGHRLRRREQTDQ